MYTKAVGSALHIWHRRDGAWMKQEGKRGSALLAPPVGLDKGFKKRTTHPGERIRERFMEHHWTSPVRIKRF